MFSFFACSFCIRTNNHCWGLYFVSCGCVKAKVVLACLVATNCPGCFLTILYLKQGHVVSSCSFHVGEKQMLWSLVWGEHLAAEGHVMQHAQTCLTVIWSFYWKRYFLMLGGGCFPAHLNRVRLVLWFFLRPEFTGEVEQVEIKLCCSPASTKCTFTINEQWHCCHSDQPGQWQSLISSSL